MPIRPFSTVPGSTVSLTDAVGVCVLTFVRRPDSSLS